MIRLMDKPNNHASSAPPHPSFLQALAFWLKLGCISFGGPAGQIAIMHQELVEKRRWISEGRFLHALNYCMILPGPEAQQLATYIGWILHGTKGGLAAGILFVAPAMLLLMLLAGLYLAFGHTPFLVGLLAGIKPAVVALVMFAAYRIASKTLKHPLLWAIAIAAFIGLSLLHIGFPWILLGAACCGLVANMVSPGLLGQSAHAAKPSASRGASVVDDDTPTPDHALFRRARLVKVILTCLTLAACAYALAASLHPELASMGRFFTQVALVTFGGAYAVLPYVVQGAVEQFHWLSAAQMMDGLALGESTPGPLIIIVTFVGYLGGVSKQVAGANHEIWSGILGGLVVTFFTFLPSFAFILAGGPLVESTRKNLGFTAPLTAITAAVVGVIASLALFFGQQVLVTAAPYRLHVGASLIASVALYSLIRHNVGVIRLLTVSALAGLAFQALGIN
jgi:chromate transporter